MQLFKSVAASALFIAALVEAKVSFTSFPSEIQVGKQYDITWTDAEGPVTILLKKGKPEDLKTVSTLTTTGTDGKYQWTPAGDLAPGEDYALEIDNGSDVNYSNQFPVKGGKGPSKLVASSTTLAASSIVPTVPVSGVAKPTGNAQPSGWAVPSGTGSNGSGAIGPKPTANLPPLSNNSFKNAASTLALIAGVAAAFALN